MHTRRRAVIVCATAVALSTLTSPALAAVGDEPTAWTDDQTVRSPLNGRLASWDVVGRAAIAVSVDVSGAAPVFNFYTAVDDGDWVFGGSLNAPNSFGTPDVATDGRYWKVVWERRTANRTASRQPQRKHGLLQPRHCALTRHDREPRDQDWSRGSLSSCL